MSSDGFGEWQQWAAAVDFNPGDTVVYRPKHYTRAGRLIMRLARIAWALRLRGLYRRLSRVADASMWFEGKPQLYQAVGITPVASEPPSDEWREVGINATEGS